MRAGTLLQGLVFGLSLTVALEAEAQDSQLNKAEKALLAFEGGDPASLEAAWAALEAASANDKTRALADTWIRRGHVARIYVLRPDVAGAPADPVAEMNRSFAEALERSPSDAERGAAVDDLRAVVSAASMQLFNDVEAGLWADAYAKLAGALESRRLLAAYGVDEPHEQLRLLRLAVLVATYTERFDEAAEHHATLVQTGEFDPTVTVQLAKKLAAKRGGADALAFLQPIAAEHPQDSTLLTTEVELLLEAGKNDEAVARLDAAATVLGEGVGPQLMLGALYLRAGADDAAHAAYSKALARDPNVQEALVPMARFLLADAAEADALLDADPTEKEKDEVTLERFRGEAYARAIALLEKRREAAADDHDALELLRAAYEAVGDAEAAQRIADLLSPAP